jgi:hypothetical protein
MGTHISITQPICCHASFIKHCEDYYVGKQKANDMRGTKHGSEILLDNPNDTNSLAPNAPYYNNDEYSKNDPNENQQFDFDNDMENPFHSLYIVIQCHT